MNTKDKPRQEFTAAQFAAAAIIWAFALLGMVNFGGWLIGAIQ